MLLKIFHVRTYTMPTGVTATNLYITVTGWQKATQDWSLPLTYTLPDTGSYSITVPWHIEYQLEAHYDVSDGRISPDSPVVTAW